MTSISPRADDHVPTYRHNVLEEELMQDIHKGFQTADQTTDAEFLFRFLDRVHANESVQSYHRLMLDLAPVVAGQRILEIGSGIGTVAMQLAEQVGPSGYVLGIDKNEMFIREAQRRGSSRNLPVEFQVGDANQLDLPDASFDAARAERTLMYLENPGQALDELVRVLKPGGEIVIFEFDYDVAVIDTSDRELKHRIARLLGDSVASAGIGRQAQRLFKERGLEGVAAMPHLLRADLATFKIVFGAILSQAVQSGKLEAAEVAGWWAELEQAEQNDTFFVGLLGFVVYGRKPATA